MQYRGADKHLHTHVLLYCILVYSCTCLKGLATVQKCDIVTHQFIHKYFCSHVCCLFFFHPFLCKRVAFFLLVTNLLINCEDVSCPLTCAQITSWFFWFLLVFKSVWLESQNIWWDLSVWSCKKKVLLVLKFDILFKQLKHFGFISHGASLLNTKPKLSVFKTIWPLRSLAAERFIFCVDWVLLKSKFTYLCD